jgi:hypothetical protein
MSGNREDKVARSLVEADTIQVSRAEGCVAEITLRDDEGAIIAAVKLDFNSSGLVVEQLNFWRSEFVVMRSQQHKAGHA